MNILKRSKPPYTQEEIKEQQGIVAEAIRQRESLEVHKSEDYNRASTSVEVAQEILNYMLEAVESSQKK